MELSKEQLAYLKSLDSKKKKRKFLLDCFIENIELKNKIKFEPIIFKDGVFETKDKNVADFLSHFCRQSKLVEESEMEKPKSFTEFIDDFLSEQSILKTNREAMGNFEGMEKTEDTLGNKYYFKPWDFLKEPDNFKSEREYQIGVLYKGKFYKTIEEAIESQKELEKSKEPQPPTEFCVKITTENRSVLETLWCEFHDKKQIELLGKYFCSNSLFTDCFSSDNTENKYPIVTTEEFLKYIGREDFIERKSVKISDLPSNKFQVDEKGNFNKVPKYSPEINQREFTEQGSELLKFDMLEESELMNIQCLSINDIVYNRKVPYAYVTNELMNFFKEIALNNINKSN